MDGSIHALGTMPRSATRAIPLKHGKRSSQGWAKRCCSYDREEEAAHRRIPDQDHSSGAADGLGNSRNALEHENFDVLNYSSGQLALARCDDFVVGRPRVGVEVEEKEHDHTAQETRRHMGRKFFDAAKSGTTNGQRTTASPFRFSFHS